MNASLNKNGTLSAGESVIAWRIGYAGSCKEEIQHLTPDMVNSVSGEINGAEYVTVRKGSELFGNGFTVRTAWKQSENGRLEGTFEYSGKDCGPRIEQMEFPCASVPASPDSRLLFLNVMGLLYKPDVPGGCGLTDLGRLQFAAVTDEKRTSYYFDGRDTRRFAKEFCCTRSEDRKTLLCRIIYFRPLSKETGLPSALDWYWRHGNPCDTDYPEYWPPREGEKAFSDAAAELKKDGIYVQCHVNGMLWDCGTPSYREGGGDSCAAEYGFIRRTAEFYYENRDFLYDGIMLRPGGMKTDSIKVEFMARGIFTKEKELRIIARETPAVLSSEWRSPDGRMALVLANFSHAEREYEYKSENFNLSGTIPAGEYNITVVQ